MRCRQRSSWIALSNSSVQYDNSGDDRNHLPHENIARVMHAEKYPRHSNANRQRNERQRQRREGARVDEGPRHRRGSVPRWE